MRRILIANRGEIALRICRTIKEMGIEAVAVYAAIDRAAPHVRAADFAIELDPRKGLLPYLDQEQIVEKAIALGVDAIHPGYGFLSENGAFARLVQERGLLFIGPQAHSIETMGDKLKAKEAVSAFSVPLIEGSDQALNDGAKARAIASKIGYPVLIKAAAGGGGKGMRAVHNELEFDQAFARAQSEAVSSFGDGRVFVERFIEDPKHIEVQILADQHGNVIHLFERDCSIQRRHQKVIEEAPGPTVSEDIRKKLGEAAIEVAKSCKYHGAGTVEFLLDTNNDIFFLEMNTRLQVEHPVTEMITGMDLVEEQIRVARGEHLRYRQEDLKITGHAIELRIYAEDPFSGFLPDVGFLEMFELPLKAAGVRLDSGYVSDMEIPLEYDPLLAKLIVHAEDRSKALEKIRLAINSFLVRGVETTLPFGTFVFNHPVFQKGLATTDFVEQHFTASTGKDLSLSEELAARLALFFYKQSIQNRLIPTTDTPST